MFNNEFTKICSCGYEMQVLYQTLAGHNENEEYYCPACNQEYSIFASFSPTIISKK